jgi:hypothetical protein
MDDSEIAALIAAEARSSHSNVKKHKIVDVNKQFLVNTVLSLSSHNIREVSDVYV